MDISKLIITDEQWASMTAEQRLSAISEGDLNSHQMAKIHEEGSEEEKAALSKYLKDHRAPSGRTLLANSTASLRS